MKLLSIITGVLLLAAAGSAARVSDINQAVVEQIYDNYQLDPQYYQVEVLASSLKTDYNDSLDIIIESLSQKEPRGLFTILVSLYKDKNFVEKGQVRLRIKKFAEVLVATTKIERNEVLSEDKLILKMMDITSLQEQPVESFDAINGYRSKRNLFIGRILTSDAVEPVPDIDVGREVSIVYTNGLFSVSTTGKALQKGWTGDYVKVRNNDSGKIILARVVDEGAVVIDP